MSDHAPLRKVDLWAADVATETRADGTVLVHQRGALPAYPDRLSDRIRHWAQETPEQVWMAERSGGGADSTWVKVSYAELHRHIQSIGQYLLDLQLSVERPLIILSGNSLSHALMALGAQYAGVPSAAVAPAYALVGKGYGKLSAIRDQITPGAVFVDKADKFKPAIDAVFADLPLLAEAGDGLHTDWDSVLATEPASVVAANAATGPDTVAKFMFTSGTTGSPKAVIQTQRMLCSNMEMVADCFAFFRNEPPLLLDWAPWNHVASGSKVFNMALYHGGTYYIDGGKPAPGLIDQTIRNIKDVSPNWYFNVPSGYDMLIEAMQQDATLAKSFFKNSRLLMYAGAAMAEHTWKNLDKLAIQATGERVLLCTGLGATETAPFALFCTEPQEIPGNVGVPAKGLTLKLVPAEGKFEARIKGPSVTPGYWRDEKLTADAFDDEGYYCLGDALKFVDTNHAAKGFYFDGRVAENFKMATGTWVAVGGLRAAVTNVLQGIAKDVVVTGEGRAALGALIVPFRPAAERLVEQGETLSDAELYNHPAVTSRVGALLAEYNATAGGSSMRIARALFLVEPLSLDAGEVTDKGSVNQRRVLQTRESLVEKLYTEDSPEVIVASAG